MRISHTYHYVFLAFPRTASLSIRRVLDEYSDIQSVHSSEVTPDFPFRHHISARELEPIFDTRGWQWDQYKRFCVVRNPYSRLVSLFYRRTLKGPRWDVRLPVKNNLSTLLLRILPRRSAFTFFIMTRSPYARPENNFLSFVSSESGKVLVSDILRFENLTQELPPYLNHLGIPISPDQIPHFNRSETLTDYRDLYTPFTREIVHRSYRAVLDQFGYEF